MDKDIQQTIDLLISLRDECDKEYQKRLDLHGTFKDKIKMERNIFEKRSIGRKKYRLEKAIEQLIKI